VTLATFFWILVAQAIGGSAPALTKLALHGMGPWTLVVFRQLLGVLFLALFLRVGTGQLRPQLRETLAALDRRDWALMLAVSWAGFALPQVLGAIGLTLSSATNGALLSPLEPIGILIGGAVFFRERLGPARLVAVALAVAGALLIVSQGNVDPAAGNLRGDATMAVGHLAWAIYTLAAKPLLARHDALRVTFVAAALSPWPLLPLAVTEPFEPALAVEALGWIALLAFLATAVGTYAWNRALRDVSAGTMAMFIFLQPLWGLVLGRLLGEPVGAVALAGAVLIVAGTTLGAARGPGHRAVPAANDP
jgi:drug/metabolite transporter (DMT)-like permease